ncbi:UNVERIFIED_CONTAM: hypothetical protein FKN15_046719 [Acipenser sinensis]
MADYSNRALTTYAALFYQDGSQKCDYIMVLHILVFDIARYQESLAAYFCLSAHENINQIAEILLGEARAYVFFEKSHGDMHSFVRTCKKLREDEAARLFHQIASAVAHCHDSGVVLRDLKLRKFVFKNQDRRPTQTRSCRYTPAPNP